MDCSSVKVGKRLQQAQVMRQGEGRLRRNGILAALAMAAASQNGWNWHIVNC